MTASRRFLPVVTVRDFSSLANCYAGLNARVRPGVEVRAAGKLMRMTECSTLETWGGMRFQLGRCDVR